MCVLVSHEFYSWSSMLYLKNIEWPIGHGFAESECCHQMENKPESAGAGWV
jgi:hypothetical protein